jgi:hypothetical protein
MKLSFSFEEELLCALAIMEAKTNHQIEHVCAKNILEAGIKLG